MREIKFRAKVADSDYENEKQTEMIGSFVHFTGFIGLENDIGYVEQLEEINGVGWFNVDLKTLGQYTGLKDTNSKEIYEGDIVQSIYDETYVSVVEYCTEGIGSCGCCYNKFEGAGFKAKDLKFKECIVIGNIYENPELLGDSK